MGVSLFVGAVSVAVLVTVAYKKSTEANGVRQAWYLDEDVLLEGYTDDMTFYPRQPNKCGFDAQRYTKKDINMTVFHNLDKAVLVCSQVCNPLRLDID